MESFSWKDFLEKEKRAARLVLDFGHRLWRKISKDDVVFLASGISFNILLCLIPLLLLVIYVMGLWFRQEETIRYVDRIIATAFPNQPYALTIRQSISTALSAIVANGRSLGILSILFLAAASASLFSSMRTVLHQVFEIQVRRSLLVSYLFDLSLVLGLSLMVLLTTLFHWLYRGIKQLNHLLPAEMHMDFLVLLGILPDILSIGIICLLCFLIYRFVPAERIPRKTAWIAAGSTSLIWEISARLFAWYLSTLTSLSKTYGAYAFILVLMVWIFYSSMIFILGAEAAHVLRQNLKSEDEHQKDDPGL